MYPCSSSSCLRSSALEACLNTSSENLDPQGTHVFGTLGSSYVEGSNQIDHSDLVCRAGNQFLQPMSSRELTVRVFETFGTLGSSLEIECVFIPSCKLRYILSSLKGEASEHGSTASRLLWMLEQEFKTQTESHKGAHTC